jgi:hypothetical protein
MSHPHQQDDGPLPAPSAVGHETSDAQAGPIIRFLIFLAVLTIATAGLMVVFHHYLENREAKENPGRYPLAAGRERPLPPPPRLQTYPFDDVKELRRSEARYIHRYEWVDQNSGVVRIPIERAMDLIAERGLPHRTAKPAEGVPEAGNSAPEAGNAAPGTGNAAPDTGSPAPEGQAQKTGAH